MAYRKKSLINRRLKRNYVIENVNKHTNIDP